MTGYMWTEEQRKAQAERATRQMADSAMREKISKKVSASLMGHTTSEETKRKLATQVGWTHTEEAKQANREAHLGGKGFAGPHCEESKRKMSESQLGNQNALVHCMSTESRRRMIESLRKKWQDPEFLTTVAECYNRKPNELELSVQHTLDKHFPGEWKYVGDYQVWLGRRNPDFINVDGRKQVIEVFGIFWHDTDLFPNRPTEDELIEYYKEWGFDCLILWEDIVWEGESVIVEKIKTWRRTLCAHGS